MSTHQLALDIHIIRQLTNKWSPIFNYHNNQIDSNYRGYAGLHFLSVTCKVCCFGCIDAYPTQIFTGASDLTAWFFYSFWSTYSYFLSNQAINPATELHNYDATYQSTDLLVCLLNRKLQLDWLIWPSSERTEFGLTLKFVKSEIWVDVTELLYCIVLYGRLLQVKKLTFQSVTKEREMK